MQWGYLQSGGRSRAAALASLAVALRLVPASFAATVTFESDVVPLGQKYGQDFGQRPGETVLSQDLIDMSVHNLTVDSMTFFVRAEVGGQYASIFSSTPLELREIAVAFDFRHLPFTVTAVTFEVGDIGGSSNFAVNDSLPQQLDAIRDLPGLIVPGIGATVIPLDAQLDRITLVSLNGTPIERFLIGGQELSIDNITAVPEPGSLLLLGLATTALLRRRPNRA